MVIDRLIHFVDSIASIAEVYNFDVKFCVKKDVLALDVAMGDSFGIDIFKSLDELFKDASSHFF